MLFSDPVHDEFGSLILGFAPYGGGDVGEVQALSLEVREGDDDSFFDAFVRLARRRIEEGDAASAKGIAPARTTAGCGPPVCWAWPTIRSTAPR